MPPLARSALAVLVLLAGPAVAAAQDPARTDSDKYQVVLENERVRVLRYHDEPGQKTTLHAHPDLVLHALGPFTRRLHVKGGKSWERTFAAGETVFVPAQTHVGENVGKTPTDVLIVELKEPPPATAPKAR